MERKIIIAGFGGQGVVVAGSLLANAALLENKKIVGMTSYGVEVRGGTSRSSLIISDDEIASPFVDKPDILIALNQPSFDKYKEHVVSGGYLVINTSLVNEDSISNLPKDITIIKIKASDIANELGNNKTANIVAVGALLAKINLFNIKNIFDALPTVLKSKQDLVDINKKAFECGYNEQSNY